MKRSKLVRALLPLEMVTTFEPLGKTRLAFASNTGCLVPACSVQVTALLLDALNLKPLPTRVMTGVVAAAAEWALSKRMRATMTRARPRRATAVSDRGK